MINERLQHLIINVLMIKVTCTEWGQECILQIDSMEVKWGYFKNT